MVLSETLSRAAAAGLRVAPLDTLPRLRDVDTAQVGGRRMGGKELRRDSEIGTRVTRIRAGACLQPGKCVRPLRPTQHVNC